MHGSDFGMETSVPHKKRCRASKKKRLRLKKRESLEPAVGAKSDNQDEGRELSTNRDKVQNCNNFQDIEGKEAQQHQRIYDLTQFDQQQQKTRQIQDLTLNQDQIEKQDGNMDGDASEEKQVQDEMTEYERKRRDNILRNQVFMQQVGVSTAKLAARTAVGNEAENEEKRKEMVARRALAATRKAELLCQPVRKSKRLQREKVVTKARDRLLKLMTKSVGKLSGVRAVKTMDPVLFSHGDVPEMKPHSLREVAENGNDQTNSNQDQDHDQHSAPASTTEAENEAQQKEMTTRRSLVTVQKACLLSRPVGKPSKLRSEKIVMKLKTGADPGQIRPHSNLEKNDANRNISKQELDQDEQEVVTGYERKRLENILRNEAFLKQVGVSTVKVAACAALQNEAAQEAKRQELASKRALKASRRTELLKQPVRKSRRLSGEKAVVRESNGLDYSMDLLSMKTIRLNCTGKVHVMDVIDDEGKAFCQEIIGSFHERSNIEQALVPGDAEDDVEYTLETNDIVKAVPYRITTLAFLPRADRVGVACGDKEGLVSLWSPSSSNNSTTSSAAMYRPHGYPVTQLIFPTSSTLISSSMDGTVCEFDLWSSKTSLVCDISYETGITSLAESGNPQFYYASCEDGTVRLIDRRARNLYSGRFRLHKGKINTVDQHPTLD
ncbi:hypothetical protein KRP22_011959 [Phytophthora ramorum]|nr:DNA damage-binding protein CMR1 [Phytophthora ramorum]